MSGYLSTDQRIVLYLLLLQVSIKTDGFYRQPYHDCINIKPAPLRNVTRQKQLMFRDTPKQIRLSNGGACIHNKKWADVFSNGVTQCLLNELPTEI